MEQIFMASILQTKGDWKYIRWWWRLLNLFRFLPLHVFAKEYDDESDDEAATWKADNAECGAEEEDGVADIVEVEILNADHWIWL